MFNDTRCPQIRFFLSPTHVHLHLLAARRGPAPLRRRLLRHLGAAVVLDEPVVVAAVRVTDDVVQDNQLLELVQEVGRRPVRQRFDVEAAEVLRGEREGKWGLAGGVGTYARQREC